MKLLMQATSDLTHDASHPDGSTSNSTNKKKAQEKTRVLSWNTTGRLLIPMKRRGGAPKTEGVHTKRKKEKIKKFFLR